jgi:hypothetical protein
MNLSAKNKKNYMKELRPYFGVLRAGVGLEIDIVNGMKDRGDQSVLECNRKK